MADRGDDPPMVSAQMRAAVGRIFRRCRSEAIDPSAVRRWVRAVNFPEAPPDTSLGVGQNASVVAVPQDFNPFAWDVTPRGFLEDGRYDPAWIERGLGIPGPPVGNGVNGALEVEYGVPMAIGDLIEETACVAAYREKPSRSFGRTLVTSLEIVWTNQRGEPVRTLRQDVVRYEAER